MTAAVALPTAAEAARIFREAAEANRADPYRRNALLLFPGYGQVVMTGDMHGHRVNFEKLRRYAMLERAAARHVILHELIHTEATPDASHELLLEAARYKCQFPEQVHFLQSNHELSQLTGHQIMKNGRVLLEDFARSVLSAYGPDGGKVVLDTMMEFIESFPIAARTGNRIWLSHSLPGADEVKSFDFGLFDRAITPADRRHGGALYQLVWGRRFTEEQVEALASALEVDLFVLGHQPQESGSLVCLNRVIIIASDHSHGCFVPIDLSRSYTLDELAANIRKFVAVA